MYHHSCVINIGLIDWPVQGNGGSLEIPRGGGEISKDKNSKGKYSKHPHIRTHGLRTSGWNLANKAPLL